MPFKFTPAHLRRLLMINSFPFPESGLLFFGLRGCLPLHEDDYNFGSEKVLLPCQIDYTHLRCTIGQYSIEDNQIAVFPGSTVPYIQYVRESIRKKGEGANQLMTGFYSDYRKGKHKAGTPTEHDAFRQTAIHPVLRTEDDTDFDTDDRIDFTNPCDNIHAAWSMGPNHPAYASAGCQVIAGYPACEKRTPYGDSGPWKYFKENGYKSSQDKFPYMLLDALSAQRISVYQNAKAQGKLRFGSQGEIVYNLQTCLKSKGYYDGKTDGDFGLKTIMAVLEFQKHAFGSDADDGVVGPITASALGFQLPLI